MDIRIFDDEISHIRTVPFCVTVNDNEYYGVFTELRTTVGGMVDYSYEITWEGEVPEVDEDKLMDEIFELIR